MSMFVLQRNDGFFVAFAGSLHSYVKALQDARVFPTAERADAARCPENERVVRVDDLFNL
jgi:hypothetical protein